MPYALPKGGRRPVLVVYIYMRDPERMVARCARSQCLNRSRLCPQLTRLRLAGCFIPRVEGPTLAGVCLSLRMAVVRALTDPRFARIVAIIDAGHSCFVSDPTHWLGDKYERWVTREYIRTEQARRRSVWHRWFAWHPVVVKVHDEFDHWVWFECLERKWSIGKYGGGLWRYRHPRARETDVARDGHAATGVH